MNNSSLLLRIAATMDPDERITALKKAYAEILLNTAKEEAARIIVSERKAQRFEHELKLAKEEALRMLIRLKHMMDAKISEAELASLSQQKKIEELEAQVQEAEDIVKDLREELSGVQSELERATNEKIQHLNNQCIPTQEVNRLHTSQTVELRPPESPVESIIASAMKHDCYFPSIYTGSSYRGVPNLPSIISRRKEPELYRNGCTHRIRACHRNQLDQAMSSPGQARKTRNEKIIRDNKGVRKIHKKHEDENKSNVEKKVVQAESCLPNWSSIKKRKRVVRYKRNGTPSFGNSPDQSLKIDQARDNSFSRNHPISGENPSGNSPRLLSDIGEHGETSEDESKIAMFFSDQSTIDTDEVLAEKRESSEVAISEMSLTKSSSPLRKQDPEASETSSGQPSGLLDDRRFKYTFQRKRKRESKIKLDESISLRNNLTEENASSEKYVSEETASAEKYVSEETASPKKRTTLEEKSTLEKNTSLENHTLGDESGRGAERFY